VKPGHDEQSQHGEDTERAEHTIWLVRHGESTWNASGLVQGQADGPILTEAGREQAAMLADAVRLLPIRRLVTSDLTRAEETASIIGQKLNLTWDCDAAVRERDFGAAQGLPLSALEPEWSGIEDERVVDADARPPGGESLRELGERVNGFFDRLARERDGEGDGDVLVVTHGGIIRLALAQCDRVPVTTMPWVRVPNAGLWSLSTREICPPVLL
jgi:broad specificity phosphatase PhoE